MPRDAEWREREETEEREMLVQDVVASVALRPADDQVAAVWLATLKLSLLPRRFRGSVGLDGGVA